MTVPREPGSTTPSGPVTSEHSDSSVPLPTEQAEDAKFELPPGDDGTDLLSASPRTDPTDNDDDDGEWDAGDVDPTAVEPTTTHESEATTARTRKRRRQPKLDSPELRLRGRRALCKRVEDIAPHMLKMVKLRILTNYLPSVRGLEDEDLTRVLREDAAKITDRSRVLAAVNAPDADFNRGQLKAMILNVLLQEETHSLPENRLDEKVIEFETAVVERSKSLDLTELRKDDPDRWHHFDTYRIVLDAAWSNDDTISPDEARLLGVLRSHLSISLEEHWLISALLKRFPKAGSGLHTADEVNEARKELQRWRRTSSTRCTGISPTTRVGGSRSNATRA